MSRANDVELRGEIEELLYREAWLLDHGRLDEWLGLFTDDATYWIPLQADQTDLVDRLDDRRLLEVRVRQFQHPRAHARVPAPRNVHQIASVRVIEAAAHEMRVSSSLILLEHRRERQRVWGALVEHACGEPATGSGSQSSESTS